MLHLWARYKNSSLWNIGKASLILAIVTIATKLLGLGKEILIAKHFGVTSNLDAFILALMLPTFFLNVIGGAFGSSFLPKYSYVFNQKKEKYEDFFASVFWLWFIILFFLLLLFWLFGPFLLELIISPKNFEKSIKYYDILLPSFFFLSLRILIERELNVRNIFSFGAFAPGITSLTIVIALYLIPETKVVHYAYAFFLGSLLEFLWVLPHVKIKFLINFKSPLFVGKIKQIFFDFFFLIGGIFLMSSTGVVDTTMASYLGVGNTALLNYGLRVPQMISSFGALILGTAIFPYFSKKVNRDELTKKFVKKFFVTNFIFLITSLFFLSFLLFFSLEIVQIIFQRGEFSIVDALNVSDIQFYYFLQIPFYILAIIGVRILTVLRKNKYILAMSVVNSILNILFNILFMDKMGVRGIALSTSIVYMIFFVMVFIAIYFYTREIIQNGTK